MDLGIKGKRALVTGASRGLGRAVSLGLAEEGVKVAVVARDGLLISKVVKEMGPAACGHYGVTMDLTKNKSAEALKRKLEKNFGMPDIIVHNLGGTLGIKGPLADIADYQKVWRFNIGIAIELNRLFLPHMQRGKWGRIVHISSSAAVTADASLPYCSAKAALNAYVKGLGRNVAKDSVIVSAVMPGPFMYKGSHWDNVAREDPQRLRKLRARTALNRLAKPEEISGMVVFLCSERASFCAGSVVPVDGGIA